MNKDASPRIQGCLKKNAALVALALFAAISVAQAGEACVIGRGARLTSGDYDLFLTGSCSTIAELRYRGKLLMGKSGGWNGTVITTFVPESGKLDWVGTGHGRETVESVALFTDGKEQPMTNGARYEGASFQFVKQSDLRIFKLRVVDELTPAGLSEAHTYTALTNAPTLGVLYAFMHKFDVGMGEWTLQTPGGETQSGLFRAGGFDKPVFETNIAWVAVYNPTACVGAVYAPIAPCPSPFHFCLNRPGDRKLYAHPTVAADAMKAGETMTFRVRLAGFEAEPDRWKQVAAEAAARCAKPE